MQEPLEALEVDSLTLLEYVMAVEEAFNVELDENEVNACGNIPDLVQLVETALNGPKSLDRRRRKVRDWGTGAHAAILRPANPARRR